MKIIPDISFRSQQSIYIISQINFKIKIFFWNIFQEIPYKFKVAVMIEYIRSLSQRDIPVQHYLYELIINVLVHNNCFYQLHQFLQYHVLSDSKPLVSWRTLKTKQTNKTKMVLKLI